MPAATHDGGPGCADSAKDMFKRKKFRNSESGRALTGPRSVCIRARTKPNVGQQLRDEFFCRRGVTEPTGQLHDHVAQVGPPLDQIRFATGGEAEQDGRGVATSITAQK